MGSPGGPGSCRTSWPPRGHGRPRGSAALQRTSLASSRAREAARERGPPTDGPRSRGRSTIQGPRITGNNPRPWDRLEGPAPAGPPGLLADTGGRAGARPSNGPPWLPRGPGRPRGSAALQRTVHGHGDDLRSWVPGSRAIILDHGIAWRVRLVPDLLASSRTREAARERAPPTDLLGFLAGPGGRAGARPSNGRSTVTGTIYDPGSQDHGQ